MRSIYILLTRSDTILSRTISRVTGDSYTHASLSFSKNLTRLYSFGRKFAALPFPGGFVSERLDGGFYGAHGDIPALLLELQVSDKAYQLAKRQVRTMVRRAECYRYSVRGLMKCRRGVAWEREGYYFCSQFVAEVLDKSGAAQLPKPPSLMRPLDYDGLPQAQCLFRGQLGELAQTLSPQLPTVPAPGFLQRLPELLSFRPALHGV